MALGRRLISLVIACCVVALAGCGGGDDDLPDVILKDAPRPAESIKEAEEKFVKATGENTCATLEPLVHSQYRSQSAPGSPLTADECKTLKAKYKALKGFTATGNQAFQTVGVVDGELGGDPATVLFALDSDRRWKFVSLVQAAKQAGTPNNALNEFDSNAKAFVEAFRGKSCSTLFSLVSISSPYYVGAGRSARAFCRSLVGNAKDTNSLAYQLARDPGAKPKRLGGTNDFAFYGLSMKSGRYDTLIMITQPKDAPPKLAQGKSQRAFYEILSARPPKS